MDHQPTTIGPRARPVRVEAGVRMVRVEAVVPCFNRQEDLDALAGDLAACELETTLAGTGERVRIGLSVIVVDNASEPGLVLPRLPESITVQLVRLASNTGGSGGYNAGMAVALEGEPAYLWLVDSDARVEPDTLARLVLAMEADDSIVALGPALADTETGEIQEVGGAFDRKTGRFGPAMRELPDGVVAGETPTPLCNEGVCEPIGCDYVAACCVLVRADRVREIGLMPEVFLNCDDVEWCLRLAGEVKSGGRDARPTGVYRVAVLPAARAGHPRFDRFGTLPRYFGARNAFGPIDALELGGVVRFRRAMREVMRAVNQHMMARPDLARLHLRGLHDAVRGRMRGLPGDLPKIAAVRPLEELGAALSAAGVQGGAAAKRVVLEWPGDMGEVERARVREGLEQVGLDADEATRAPTRSLAAMLRRAVAGPRFAVAVVPAKGMPAHWLVGRVMVALLPGGFVLRQESRWVLMGRCAAAVVWGGWLALRLGMRGRRRSVLPRVEATRALVPMEYGRSIVPEGRSTLGTAPEKRGPQGATVSVIVLSYNRKAALLETLARLREGEATREAEIIVVDNGSSDGSVEAVREQMPWVRVIALEQNEAIAGFNRGVEAAAGELVLILDDDARPEPEALAGAVELLSKRADLAAVTLLPVHPATGEVEWPFAGGDRGGRDAHPTTGKQDGQDARPAEESTSERDDWPVMGCCNLVRRSVWRAVGGYDESFFLYRNDVELALKILATGRGVYFDPSWRCEHDSPAAARKSARWCRLATRNWIWLARRHGQGFGKLVGLLAGWAWAHKLAGVSLSRQWAVVQGVAEGVMCSPAAFPACVQPDGRAFATLLRLRFRR